MESLAETKLCGLERRRDTRAWRHRLDATCLRSAHEDQPPRSVQVVTQDHGSGSTLKEATRPLRFRAVDRRRGEICLRRNRTSESVSSVLLFTLFSRSNKSPKDLPQNRNKLLWNGSSAASPVQSQPLTGPLRFIHNDVCPDHLLVDREFGCLVGLIDWTSAAHPT